VSVGRLVLPVAEVNIADLSDLQVAAGHYRRGASVGNPPETDST
jgi:hypothetical protein